jgi:hypothetical protein
LIADQPIDEGIHEVREIDVASPLAAIMNDVINYAGQHRNRFGEEPTEGSAADLETRNAGETISERRQFDIRATHEQAAGICIQSAGYLLNSLIQLLRKDMALFGFQVVTRAIVETSVKAWWLVDPAASVDTRLARLYVDNLTNINEMAKVGRVGDTDARPVELRRRALAERAESAGVAPKYNSKSQLIGFGEVSKPESTKMAGQFFEALGFEHGEYWYRSLSAICHGTAYGLLDHYMLVDIPGSELKSLAPNLSVEDVLHAAILSMQAYLGAIEFDSMLMGWDHQDVAQHRELFHSRMVDAASGQ